MLGSLNSKTQRRQIAKKGFISRTMAALCMQNSKRRMAEFLWLLLVLTDSVQLWRI